MVLRDSEAPLNDPTVRVFCFSPITALLVRGLGCTRARKKLCMLP
jgi:hypothetical protein